MNTLYIMSRASYINAMYRHISVGELIQAQIPRLETRELLAHASSNMLNHMQPTITDSLTILVNVESAMGRGIMAGTERVRHSRDVTESKPVNALAIFSGKDTESFRDWSTQVAEIMEKLKPGSREFMREVDRTKKEIWDRITHDEVFSDSQRLKDLYTDLNADMWWILTVKTTG